MRVFMTGGTGFVGGALGRGLLEAGHEVTVLTRGGNLAHGAPSGAAMVRGDPTQQGSWQEEILRHDAVVNLAGASIFRRWTRKAKNLILESRIGTTKNVVSALADSGGKKILISASAVGYYGFRGDEDLKEGDRPGDDFLASVCRRWEAEAGKARSFGIRVAICRLGIVLAARGGALGKMIPIFKKGLGSPLGSGRQWFSWVHREDLVRMVLFLLEGEDLEGPFNCTAPEPVTNRDFTRALAEALGRPAFLPPVPGLVLRLIKGEFGSVLLEGQRVRPSRFLDAGFDFRFPAIRDALYDLMERERS